MVGQILGEFLHRLVWIAVQRLEPDPDAPEGLARYWFERLDELLMAGHPAVDPDQAILKGRVGHHVGRDLIAAEPLFGADLFQGVEQAFRAIAGFSDLLQTQLVCLGLIVPAVGQRGTLAGRRGSKGERLYRDPAGRYSPSHPGTAPGHPG